MLIAVAAEPESATEASDAELAGRVRGGDRAAEAELFRRLAPRVRLYGLRHLRDPAAADDLVQDVLLMTFDSLRAGKVREDERLASYVLGTCRRMAIGLARSTTRRRRLLRARPMAIRRQVPSTYDARRSSSRTLPARRLSNVINRTSWTRSSAAAGSRRC